MIVQVEVIHGITKSLVYMIKLVIKRLLNKRLFYRLQKHSKINEVVLEILNLKKLVLLLRLCYNQSKWSCTMVLFLIFLNG